MKQVWKEYFGKIPVEKEEETTANRDTDVETEMEAEYCV